MRVIVRKAPAPPDSGKELSLLTPEINRWDELGSNLVALLASVAVSPRWDARPPFAIALQPRWDPRRSMTASVFCHVAVAFLLLNLTALLRFTGNGDPAKRLRLDSQRLEWYRMSDLLPSIGAKDAAEKPQEKGGRHKAPARQGASILHPQTEVSNPEQPDNREQTIIQPDAPKIKIAQTQPLPNIVMWQEVERPAPPVDLVKAPLRMPSELVRRNVPLPEDIPNMERRLGDLKVASALVTTPTPSLPVEPATTTTANVPPAPPAQEALPAPPDLGLTGSNSDTEARVRRLVVLNANPSPPKGPIEVPAGNRAGAFSAGPGGGNGGTPNGTPGGSPEGGAGGPAPAGDGTLGGKRDLATLRIPGISVLGGGAAVAAPVVSAPAAPRAPLPAAPGGPPLDVRTLTSRTTRPSPGDYAESRNKPEPGFAPGKRVYTLFLNMPNLGSSSGGGSWLLRFAELELRPGQQVDIAAPVAMRKVDPGYEPDAARERVEGKVRLHAIIRRDGHVDTVEVLHSVDPRLDQRAINAFLKWQFQPALRLGVPVDLEAVVEIPFSLPKPN
jgi:TonB family protein